MGVIKTLLREVFPKETRQDLFFPVVGVLIIALCIIFAILTYMKG